MTYSDAPIQDRILAVVDIYTFQPVYFSGPQTQPVPELTKLHLLERRQSNGNDLERNREDAWMSLDHFKNNKKK